MLHKVCLRTGRQRHSSHARPSPHANTSRRPLRAVLLRKVCKDKELQEDRNVFAQLMMVSKSLPEIDIREAIGQHEFSVNPTLCLQMMGQCFIAQ